MKEKTNLILKGTSPRDHHGIINPPVYRASTILYDSLEAYQDRKGILYTYGLSGTPTTSALEEALSSLEQGEDTVLFSSGLQALVAIVMSFVKSGEHILVPDNAYWPMRDVCDKIKQSWQVDTSYYPYDVGEKITDWFQDNTKLVFIEAPGSLSFEMSDIPAIAAMCKKANILTVCDNSWSSGYFFKPLLHGVDMSVVATTKYISGHSDVMMGHVTTRDQTIGKALRDNRDLFGFGVSSDEAWLTLRGLRSLSARLEQHQKSALEIATFLEKQPLIHRILCPALKNDPGYEIWKRDFTGCCGLFSFTMLNPNREALALMIEGMKLFGLGSSWGGYKSLLTPFPVEKYRTATQWPQAEQLLRIHVGLEDVSDLIEDLEAGFERFKSACA